MNRGYRETTLRRVLLPMLVAAAAGSLVPASALAREGGDMLQPMAVAAIGGLLMEIAVALFLMPAGYVMFTRAHAIPTSETVSSPGPVRSATDSQP